MIAQLIYTFVFAYAKSKLSHDTPHLFLCNFSGNHEYYTIDVHNWVKKLTTLGIKVLHNENIPLPNKEDRRVCLAGVNDPMADEYMYVRYMCGSRRGNHMGIIA